MTHVVRELFDKIAVSGCPVVTYDLATDIILAFAVSYSYHNRSKLQTSNIRCFSVGYNPIGKFLDILVRCDDDMVYSVTFTFERLESYKEVNK